MVMNELEHDDKLKAILALEQWGKWQRQGNGKDRSPGLEGKFRTNRCPTCFEDDDPCEACRYLKGTGEVLDLRLVLAVERAISYGTMRVSMGGGRARVTNGCSVNERDILLNHYRGKVDAAGTFKLPDLRFRRDRLGMHAAQYDAIVAKLTQEVWNRAKRNMRA
ncbi:hypothetical protein B0T37_10565 [Chromobacterium violaceum]|nr:hypothetical protein B0T38_10960 [Chromobacterium violaceum]OQS26498.1 hypothetical protein B0T37_10565 [Chromobacterium violaceum]